MQIQYDDFAKIDMRAGKIIKVEDFPKARVPTYKVEVDFGDDIGVKKSSVQAKSVYTKEQLLGMQVIGVINLPEKNIAGFLSQVLIIGVKMDDDSLTLLEPSRKPARIGSRVY
ncbi:MAG: tRNA-binding protein [Nitrososphaerota archaeon]|jgi:tRNA-binding protein|nr:tRNA-binding protein [Nitrososphaerota archaeon]